MYFEINKTYLYLCMFTAKQRLTCPICEKLGLSPMVGFKKTDNDRTLCSNEFYSHIARGGRHYLVRSQRSILEEQEESREILAVGQY